MSFWLTLIPLLPLAGFLLSLLLPRTDERALGRVAFWTALLQMASVIAFTLTWVLQGAVPLNVKGGAVYTSGEYEFHIDLLFDRIGAFFLITGAVLIFLVTAYSRAYLHREEGFKRFFNTLLFFCTGYSLIVVSGNLETLFIGWEVLGICSFLLIAFYRFRALPVRNAVKVFSIYRLGDVGLILAMWMSHHLWHENITFLKLMNHELVHGHLNVHSRVGVFISLMLLLTAAVKSAQLPFSSWLPRAMEGPTPSSAIFYGSLSVHIGVFLLLRTEVLWAQQSVVRFLIGGTGAVTALLAMFTARVQSSVKAQIAYASIGQIGLIFIEVAAGWDVLALVHFSGNAFLRTYQLLVSPSVVTYLIREQFFHFKPRERRERGRVPLGLERSIYVLSLKEWNLEELIDRFLWKPMRVLGRSLDMLSIDHMLLFFTPLYLMGWVVLWRRPALLVPAYPVIALAFACIALVLVLRAYMERTHLRRAWFMAFMVHYWIALAVSFNQRMLPGQMVLYLAGVTTAAAVGILVIRLLRATERYVNLSRFQGHALKHPVHAFVFLLACLGLAAFPITPSFIGFDVLFTYIRPDQPLLALIAALCFVIEGLALVRMYARLFLGPYVRDAQAALLRSI